MPTAELFDGTQLEFEDGTPDHVIEKVAREQTDRLRSEQARQPLPATVTPSTAGGGRGAQGGPTAADLRSARSPGLASVRSAAAAVQRERDTPPTPEGGSVLDQPYQDTSAGTDPATGLTRMSDAEYQANYSANSRPAPTLATSRDTIKNTPAHVVAGERIRQALGDGVPAAAVQGVISGAASIGKVVPGLVAGAADLADSAGVPGAAAVRDFSLGQARTADEFGDAVQGKGGGYYTKLVGNVFNSVTQNIPTIAFGLGGATEIVAGKAVANAAAKQAANNAMKALFVQTAGQEYGDSRNAGFDPAESAARASIFGAAEVLGERFGFHEQMAVLRAAVGKRQLGSHELGRVLATEMLKEIPGEELTTALEFLADKYGPAAKNPKATLADYFEQAADTAAQTIGQTLLMGAPASLKGTYQRADAAAAYDSAKLNGLHVTPPYTTDSPDAQRAKTVGIFNAVAAQYGMDPEAVKRATETAKGMPAADVGPFLAKLIGALQKRQLVAKPVDQHAVDVLTAGPIDDPKVIDQRAKDAETETKPVPGEPKELPSETKPASSETPGGRIAQTLGLNAEDLSGLSEPSAPVSTATGPSIDAAAHEAAHSPTNDLPEPTDAQKLAGNYQKGHVKVAGLDISIENPEGSTRSGVGTDGKVWSNEVNHHYGYIRGTVAADKEHIDTFIKPGTTTDYAGPVFVVDQNHADGTFDEPKVMLGFDSEAEAKAAYLSNYHTDWNGLRNITPMTLDGFKAWAFDPAKSTHPAAPGDSGDKKANEEKDSGNGRSATTRPIQASAIRDVVERQGSVQQPQESVLSQLRGARDQDRSSTGSELSSVSRGGGRAADTSAHAGAQGEQRSLRTGKSDLGDQKGTGAEHAQEPVADRVGANANADRMGRGAEGAADDVSHANRTRDDSGASRARVVALVGPMPNSAKPLELRPNKDGSSTAWHDGHEVLDFESGEPVQVPKGTSDADALQIVKDSGAFGRRARYFEAPKAEKPATAAAAPAPKPKSGTPGTATSDAFLERKRAERAAAPTAEAEKTDTAPAKPSATPTPTPEKPAIAPAPPAAPAVRALSDKQAFAQDYRAFEGRDVARTVQIADTGQTATLKLSAAKAMRSLDERLKTLNELKACLGRHA